jgi:hypothetical protein
MRFKVSFEIEDEVENSEEFLDLIEDMKYSVAQYYEIEDFIMEEV